jgi:hypothetical protein
MLEYSDRDAIYKDLVKLVFAFAHHLDPTFHAPVVKLSDEYEFTSAAGCGGGHAGSRWGDAERGVDYSATLTEHAADESTNGAWRVYGLVPGLSLALEYYERTGGSYTLVATGPAPAIFDVALVWGSIRLDAPEDDVVERAIARLANAWRDACDAWRQKPPRPRV